MPEMQTNEQQSKTNLFRRIIPRLLLTLMAFSTGAFAETYYVANNGDNANAGTSPASPLRTIAEASDRVDPFDTILLRRGDVFYEQVQFSDNKLTIDAYDSGDELPVVSGGTAITGWTVHSGQIYVADVNGYIKYLTFDGNHVDIARYPNRTAPDEWARTTTWTENSDGTDTVVTSNGLKSHPRNANDYWNGTNMRWHRHSWWFETRPVTDYEAATGKLYLGDASIIHIMPYDMSGWGFFLDNKFEELDAANEFYYDSSAGKVYLRTPGGANPNNALVEGSARTLGLSVSGSTVRNIAFRHQTMYGLQITGATTVEGCRFEHIGSDTGGAGLRATWGVFDAQVRNCRFENNYNAAIDWNENPSSGSSSVIEYNTLINNGTFDGYGGEGPWKAMAVVIPNSTNLHFQHNYMDGSGYAGIIFGSNGNFADYNIFINCMSTLNDGAAIYANCSQTTARHNIIIDTRGGMDSSGPWANLAHGIWPEFLSEFRDSRLEYNTIINSGGFGIFLENNFDCTLRGNTIFGCDRAAFFLAESYSIYDPQNHIVEDNVFFADDYADSSGGRTLLFDVDGDIDYGTFANNYFCNPYNNFHITPANSSWQWQSAISVPAWQYSYSSWADPNARTDLEKLTSIPAPNEPGRPDIFYNDTETTSKISFNGIRQDLDGRRFHGCIELEPFTSRILIIVDPDAQGADLNGDCVFDCFDLEVFADAWLSHDGQPHYNPDADLIEDSQITLRDFAALANQW